jgi:hypothetical protein
LEERLSKKYTNGHENFSGERVSIVLDFMPGYAKTMKLRD